MGCAFGAQDRCDFHYTFCGICSATIKAARNFRTDARLLGGILRRHHPPGERCEFITGELPFGIEPAGVADDFGLLDG